VSPPRLLSSILDQLRSEPSRTGSVIISFYGDAIAPRGGCVALATLLRFFAAIGIAEPVVRTAIHRVAREGWLESTRVGRVSFYRLTASGRTEFAEATGRIYGPAPRRGDGRLRLVVLADVERREDQRAALEAAGYGVLAPWVMIGPQSAAPPDAAAGVLVLDAGADPETARLLAARTWPVEQVGAAWRRYVDGIGPLDAALADAHAARGLDALTARVLLVHGYRRILTHDPGLPPELLPEPWAGALARAACAALWRALVAESEAWLDANATTEAGPLGPPDAAFARRFVAD
jgi:phenylacetic acid degradation operon negative regulatory protein